MKKPFAYIIPVLLIIIISCSETPKERVLTMKDVFPTQKNTDSTFIFSLDSVKYYSELEKIVCNNDNRDKYFYIRGNNYDVNLYIRRYTKCSRFGCVLIKEKNTLYVDYKSDTVNNTLHKEIFTVKNYEKLLLEQFMNRADNPSLSDFPHKVITFLTLVSSGNNYDKEEIKLQSKLDTISKAYLNFIDSFKKNKQIDSLIKVYPLNLSIYIPAPTFDSKEVPPPPTPIEIVE